MAEGVDCVLRDDGQTAAGVKATMYRINQGDVNVRGAVFNVVM